jgi:hypothetical protein
MKIKLADWDSTTGDDIREPAVEETPTTRVCAVGLFPRLKKTPVRPVVLNSENR